MPRNTLDSMVKLLGKAEITEVSAFLACPLQGAKPEHIACFRLLSQPSRKEVTDEALFANAFSDEPFDDGKLRRLKSETCRLLEDYLALKELKKSPRLRSELLIGALARKDDYQLFKETIGKRLRKLEEAGVSGQAYHAEAAFLHQALYHHPETDVLDKDNTLLHGAIAHLEHQFAIAYLQNAGENLVRQQVIDAHERLYFLEATSHFEVKQPGKFPVLQSFQALFRLLNDQDGLGSFEEVRSLVLNNLQYMAASEQQMALKLLSSKAIRFSATGAASPTHWVFELYKTSFEMGLSVGPNGKIPPNHFLNMVISAAKVGEYDWALEFLQRQKRYLPEAEREMVERLSLGSIYYQRGKVTGQLSHYSTALQHLESMPMRSHEIYNLRARSLSLRISYELFRQDGDVEPVERQLKNFDRYLQGNTTISKSKKEEYRNFFVGFRALLKLVLNPAKSKSALDTFIGSYQDKEKMVLKDWLTNKAEELKTSLRH